MELRYLSFKSFLFAVMVKTVLVLKAWGLHTGIASLSCSVEESTVNIFEAGSVLLCCPLFDLVVS